MPEITGQTSRTHAPSETWCIIKRSEVISDALKWMPRPKIVKEILLIGNKLEIFEMLEELSKDKKNQSTEDIEITVYAERYVNQKNTTSARPGNGKR